MTAGRKIIDGLKEAKQSASYWRTKMDELKADIDRYFEERDDG